MKTLWCAALVLVLMACGGGDTTGTSGTPPLLTISLDVTTASIAVGEQKAITATLHDQTGTTVIAGPGVTWTSSNASVASVDQNGLVRGVALGGPVSITVAVNGTAATCLINVTVAGVSIAPSISSLPIGQSAQLTATGVDWFSNPLSAGQATWSSSNPAVATIAANSGFTLGLSAGTTTITAMLGGKSSSFLLAVGVPSVNDGRWTGASSAVTLILDITFGRVSHLSIPQVPFAAGLTCQGGTYDEALSAPVNNNQFVVTLGASPTTINGTIATATTMQVTHDPIVIAISCRNAIIPNSPYVPGAYTVPAATTPITLTKVAGGMQVER